MWRYFKKDLSTSQAEALSCDRFQFAGVQSELLWTSSFDDALRLHHLSSRLMDDQYKLICRKCSFELYDAVLGISYGVETISRRYQHSGL